MLLTKFHSNPKFISNVEKIKQEAIWNDESQRWRIPDLITHKTKLPPAGKQSMHIFVEWYLMIN